ncbi:MAG: SsrA-binding protein SmpB [Cryomorphaceae bacterium]|jgi:SsrA-binding protein|nr:SsrA-binding protein SmpB [Cryomorphaceae bacterium]MDP4828359.1 SsrA-binding protein SmpB [Flavobacteriales bacterium]
MAVEIKNKKALYRFFLLDEFTAGMELTGSEIKSIRNGKASIVEGYCKMKKGELYVINMYIAEYENGGYANHKPKRERKLLLNRTELSKLERKLKDQGLTVVPIELFISEKGYAKLKVALAKGKKMHDKREDLKDKDIARDMDRKGE